MGGCLLACDYYAHSGVQEMIGREEITRRVLSKSIKSLPQSLLTHDTIYIPTSYYVNLMIMAELLGPSRLHKLIDIGAIKFCRFRRGQAFMPTRRDITNPGEFVEFSVRDRKNHPSSWGTYKAADFISGIMFKRFGETIPADQISQNTADVDQLQPAVSVGRKVEEAVRSNTDMQNWISSARDKVKHLRSIGTDKSSRQIFIYSSDDEDWHFNPWMRMLSIYHAQLDLHLQNVIGARDMRPAVALREPYSANLSGISPHDGAFNEICDLLSLPDFSGFDLKSDKFEEILKLRSHSSAEDFRQWLSDVRQSSDEDLSSIRKEFVSLLRHEPWTQKMPTKIVRYLGTSIPVLGPLISPLVSFVDGFLVDKFVGVNGARLFVDKLDNLK